MRLHYTTEDGVCNTIKVPENVVISVKEKDGKTYLWFGGEWEIIQEPKAKILRQLGWPEKQAEPLAGQWQPVTDTEPPVGWQATHTQMLSAMATLHRATAPDSVADRPRALMEGLNTFDGARALLARPGGGAAH